MPNRPMLIGLIVVILISAVIAISISSGRFDDDAESPAVIADTATKPSSETPAAPVAEAPREEQSAAETPQKADDPSFDIVRVETTGETVIAGRAAPNTVIEVILDGDSIGRTVADQSGNWVWVPATPLPPGDHVITLKAGPVESSVAIVIKVPELGRDLAGQPTDKPAQAMAVAVPRETAPKIASKVLQSGSAKPASNDPAATTDAVPTALSLKTIDYDDDGTVVLSGRAEAGSDVVVYLDNQAVGQAVADSSGNWSLTPTKKLPPGAHKLRLDMIDRDGSVKQRIEFPLMRAAPLKDLPPKTLVVIQPGNNLWRIATQVYGSGLRYTDIYNANRDQIRDPNLIYPGQVFGLPQQ